MLPCIFIFIIPLALTAGFQVRWKNGNFLEGLIKAERMKSPWMKNSLHFKVNPDETSGSCVLYLCPLGTGDSPGLSVTLGRVHSWQGNDTQQMLGCGLSRGGGCLGEACPLLRRVRTEQLADWQGFRSQPCCPPCNSHSGAEVAVCAGWREQLPALAGAVMHASEVTCLCVLNCCPWNYFLP